MMYNLWTHYDSCGWQSIFFGPLSSCIELQRSLRKERRFRITKREKSHGYTIKVVKMIDFKGQVVEA